MDLKPTIVIDDLLPLERQEFVKNTVVNYPHWKLVEDMSYAKTKLQYPSYGFNAMFKHPEHGILSELYEAVSVPICNAIIEKAKLEIKDIQYNRAFLQIPLDQKFYKEHNGIHVDLPESHYACVYYVNDADGETIIYDQTTYNTIGGSNNVEMTVHKKVTPKQGRVVLFDGMRYHCSSQPKHGYRCIINFDLV